MPDLAWPDVLLRVAGLHAWRAGDGGPYVAGLSFESSGVALLVARDGTTAWTSLVEVGEPTSLPMRAFRIAGLEVPPAVAGIEVVPSSLGAYSVKSYWAYLLYDLGEYGWAIRETPFDLRYQSVCSIPGGAIVSVARDDDRWISLVPLPPEGESVGMAFEIVDWIGVGSGRNVAPGIWVAQVDKYRGTTTLFDDWARAWIQQEGWSVG